MTVNIPKQVWEGKVPACFELARYEVRSNETPAPFYAMLPRHSYLTLLSNALTEEFSIFIDQDKVDEIWFEFKETPLQWHYPCGLLYDMHCDPSGAELPWQIIVHFQNFPEKKLLRCPSQNAVESHFVSMLKEADQLKHRGQVVHDISKNQHQQLWHGLKTNNFDEFWQINKKFMLGYEGSSSFKHIPIKFYYNNQVFQRLFSPFSDNDSYDMTLLEALRVIFPTLFEEDSLSDTISVVTQGIQPPLSSSLQWLSNNLSYADNFLHILVKSSLDV